MKRNLHSAQILDPLLGKVTFSRVSTKLHHMAKQNKNSDERLFFLCQYFFLTEAYFTFGRRIVRSKECHIIEMTHAAINIYVMVKKSHDPNEEERSFIPSQEHRFKRYVLQHHTAYSIPPDTFSNTSNMVALQTDSAEITPFFAIPRNQKILESAEIPIPRGLFSSEIVNEATTSRGSNEMTHTLSNIYRPFIQSSNRTQSSRDRRYLDRRQSDQRYSDIQRHSDQRHSSRRQFRSRQFEAERNTPEPMNLPPDVEMFKYNILRKFLDKFVKHG
ncbi:hypothetical protein TNIN_218841 [Trichonephila inaurata madagascariensis]|uniref:Uncharacterized protein n=1 Tax=Trichonephila inaurata madagascariensis TaxID=2747483 RepID=A0A8X7BUQ0_9ARAC|nr:hypothetical protein TNIN_218841 [Trichonephila inaurata madagascariensis]